MLIILNDPAGITGVRRHELDYRVSLQKNIERHLSGGEGAELRINGSVVDPLTDPRLDMPPCRFDQVVVALRPAGFDPFTLALVVAATAVVVGLALRPNIPGFENTAGKESPNNRLTTQTNAARAYQAIPDVYGYRRVWPDLTQRSVVEYISQVKYVTEWLAISRGKGTLTDVRYADTPIADISGSSYEVFEPTVVDGYPELGTTTLADVYEPFDSKEVNGQEIAYALAFSTLLKSGTFSATSGASTFTVTLTDNVDLAQLKGLSPSGTAVVKFTYTPGGGGGPVSFNQTCTVLSYVVAGPNVTFTFSSTTWSTNESAVSTFEITPNGSSYSTLGPFTLPTDCSQIWWNTVFLRGLKGIVVIRAEWWKIDSAGAEVSGTRQTLDSTYAADTYDQRYYTDKVTPSGGFGRYRVQFQRRSVSVSDAGIDVAKLEGLFAVRYFPTKQVPGTTVVRITTKATSAATGFSERKFNARWLRHVRELTSTSLSGSRNFARALAHLWCVAGNSIDGLDVASLQDINDEHGEDSPLLRFDGSLDDADMALGSRMALIADTARCKIWRDGTKWTVFREQVKTAPALQFDYRNLAKGGKSTISYASHLPASFDGVEIEFVDETTQQKKAYARRNIMSGSVAPGISSNPKKIQMPGCATQAQADNRADLEARRLLYQRETVSDRALADAMSIPLGELVRWVDPNDFGGDELQAGEVIAISGDVITTSEPVEWGGASSGRIVFTQTNGGRAAPATLCYPAGERQIRVDSLPASVYVADSSRQCGSRYAFSVGLTSAEFDAAGLYLVTELKPSSDRTVSIALAAYDARMYEAD